MELLSSAFIYIINFICPGHPWAFFCCCSWQLLWYVIRIYDHVVAPQVSTKEAQTCYQLFCTLSALWLVTQSGSCPVAHLASPQHWQLTTIGCSESSNVNGTWQAPSLECGVWKEQISRGRKQLNLPVLNGVVKSLNWSMAAMFAWGFLNSFILVIIRI